MNPEQIRELLERVRLGALPVEDALTALKWLPYEEMGFARVDVHRRLRTGYPEVVFCQGKTPEQAASIVARLAEAHESVLATRATAEHAAAIVASVPESVYHEAARIVEVRRGAPEPGARSQEGVPAAGGSSAFILVISAGTADIPVAEEAAVTAEALGSQVERLYDVGVAGLHRLLDQRDLLQKASVILVVAGMEGALPSVVAGLVEQPVIAVPTSVGYGASFQGLSALLTMLNSCASGIAVVNIDNGFGAGYFAHLINR
jgi:NCAIR mutase (PurE)-related protein